MATNLTTLFKNIADAIRAKSGSSDQIVAENFPAAISQINLNTYRRGGITLTDGATSIQLPDRVKDTNNTVLLVPTAGYNIKDNGVVFVANIKGLNSTVTINTQTGTVNTGGSYDASTNTFTLRDTTYSFGAGDMDYYW